jgi:hypothetical protein
MGGASFYVDAGIIRNQFQLRIINKRNAESIYKIELVGDVPNTLKIVGVDQTITLSPMGEDLKTIVLTLPQADFKEHFKFRIKVTDTARGDSNETRVMEYLGPDPDHAPAATLNAKDFIH